VLDSAQKVKEKAKVKGASMDKVRSERRIRERVRRAMIPATIERRLVRKAIDPDGIRVKRWPRRVKRG